LGEACLAVGQDFADEVNQTLDLEGVSLLLPFHHDGSAHHLGGGYDVHQEWFLPGGWHEDQGPCQECLELVKCLLGLRSPCKMISFLQKLIEGKPSLIEA
jgi:hypothetical protein